MDPTFVPKPDPEHSQIFGWILGVLSALAGMFGLKWFNRQETDTTHNSRKLETHIEESSRLLTALELRIAQLEGGTVTKGYVDGVVEDVKLDFRADHQRLADNMTAQLLASEERMTETVGNCNSALRSEIQTMQKLVLKNIDLQGKSISDMLRIMKEKRVSRRRSDR